MKDVLRSAAMAFLMFSVIPMPRVEWKKENMRYMLCCLPLVGAVIAGALYVWMLLSRELGFGRGLYAAGLTLLPVLVMGWIALRWSRLDFGSTCGMLCGAMANPMALGYANDTIEGDNPSVSYATVYPLSMFVRVILAQVVLLFFR